MATFAELSVQLDAVRNEMKKMAKEKGSEMILELFKPLFNLGVAQVSWNQYTPYFNDGEACEFRVGDTYISFTNVSADGYLDEEDGWYYGSDMERAFQPFVEPQSYSWRKYTAEDIANLRRDHEARLVNFMEMGLSKASVSDIAKAKDEVDTLMEKNEELLKMIFGDHIRVLVRSDGQIDVEEYEHD